MTCDPDVLQLGHELAVEAAHGVAGEEPGPLAGQQLVNPAQWAVWKCTVLGCGTLT